MRRPGDYFDFPLVLAAVWLLIVWEGHAWWHIAPGAKPAAQPAHGCLTASQKTALPHGVAKQDLPVNWLIGAEDVAWGGHAVLSGKYVRCALAAGDPVVEQDLADEPLVAAASGKVAYLLPLPAGAHDLNAGMQVELFDESGPPIVTGAPVIAVQNGSAFLQAAPEQAIVLDRAKARLRIVRQK